MNVKCSRAALAGAAVMILVSVCYTTETTVSHIFFPNNKEQQEVISSHDTIDNTAVAVTTTSDKPIRPFSMPIEGKKYSIFQPLYDMDESEKNPQLIVANVEDFVRTFEERVTWANSMTTGTTVDKIKDMTDKEHAQFIYLEMMKSLVSATAFNDAEKSVAASRSLATGGLSRLNEGFDLKKRSGGRDWTFVGDTMTGWARLDNVRDLIQDVVKNNIDGDYIETGVWRGGSSIFARAVLSSLGEEKKRVSYVCDSFHGLPPGDKKLDAFDKNWDNIPYLEVPDKVVANNFIKWGLLDENVVFAKGFFNETMPPLSKEIKKLSVMRLDGDMYESTVDVLYHLYDKLSIGGFLIMDDWSGFPSKTACDDFFKVHGIHPEIIKIDDLSIYWKKTEQIDIQYWRYEQSKFKEGDVKE